jgi:hypothetical protein
VGRQSLVRARCPTLLLAAMAMLVPCGVQAAGVVTEVAGPCEGSSNPSVYANSRRMAVTGAGRLLALYDPHGSGQQLAWRDPGGQWQTKTRGAVAQGFWPGLAPGDRAGAVAISRSRGGDRHAWVVTSGTEADEYPLPVLMARLSGLNHPAGPRVGKSVTVQKAGMGNGRADVAFERGPRARMRGVVTWLHHSDPQLYEVRVAWFTALGTERPLLHHRRVLFSAPNGSPTPALVPTPSGMRVVATTGRGRLRLFAHTRRVPSWHVATR